MRGAPPTRPSPRSARPRSVASAPLRALVLNCTLKPSPAASNTEALARVLSDALESAGATCETIRAVDLNLLPGVSSDEGEGDEWPDVHAKLLESEILVLATPTWFGQPSSVVKRVIERMDAMLSETDDDGLPVAFNRVAGFVVTGNEDGAHHVIAELAQAVNDIGYTVPAQAWTYWNKGPGPGPTYLETDEGHDWSARTARTAAANLVAAAEALAAHPLPKPSADERRSRSPRALDGPSPPACRGHPRCDRRHAAGRTSALAASPRRLRLGQARGLQPGRQRQGPAGGAHAQGRPRPRPDRHRHDDRRVELGQHGNRARAGLPLPRHAADLRRRRSRARFERAGHARARRRRPRDHASPMRETGDLLVARMHAVHRLLEQTPNSFWPDQYANESNPAAHAAGTMREIDEALDGRARLPVRRDEHDGHAARLRRLPARARPQHPARRSRLHRQCALRRRARPPASCPGSGRASRRASRPVPSSTS